MKSKAILKNAIKRSSRDRVIKQLLKYAKKNPTTKARVYKIARRLYFGAAGGDPDQPPPPPPVPHRSKRDRSGSAASVVIEMTENEKRVYIQLRNLLQTQDRIGKMSLTTLFGEGSGDKITYRKFINNLNSTMQERWRNAAVSLENLGSDASRLKILGPLFGFKMEGRNLVAYHREFHSTATKIKNTPRPDPEVEAKAEAARLREEERKKQAAAETAELARQARERKEREEREELEEQQRMAALARAENAAARREAQALEQRRKEKADAASNRELIGRLEAAVAASMEQQEEQQAMIARGGEQIYTLEQRDKALQSKMAEALGAVGKLVTTISNTGGTEADSQALTAVKADLQEIEKQDGMAKEEVTQKLANIQQKVIEMVSRFKDKLREKNSENSELQARIRSTTRALDAASAENERISRELTEIQSNIVRQLEIITGLEADKERLQRELAEMTGTNTQHTQNLARLRTKRNELKAKMTQALADLNAARALMDEETGTLTGERDLARRDLAEKEQKITVLEDKSRTQDTIIANLERQRLAAIEGGTREKQALQAQIDRIYKEVDEAKNEYKKLEREKDALKTKESGGSEEISRLKGVIEDLKRQLAQSEADKGANNDKNSQLEMLLAYMIMMNNMNAGAYVSKTRSNKTLIDEVNKVADAISKFVKEETDKITTGFGKKSKRRSRFTQKQIGILYKLYCNKALTRR